MGNNTLLVVSKEGDKLLLQVPNQPLYQILPASDTEYFMLESSVRVKFKANEASQTDTMVLDFDGNEQQAKKVIDN